MPVILRCINDRNHKSHHFVRDNKQNKICKVVDRKHPNHVWLISSRRLLLLIHGTNVRLLLLLVRSSCWQRLKPIIILSHNILEFNKYRHNLWYIGERKITTAETSKWTEMTVHEKHSFRCGWSQKEIKLRQIDTRSEKYKKKQTEKWSKPHTGTHVLPAMPCDTACQVVPF